MRLFNHQIHPAVALLIGIEFLLAFGAVYVAALLGAASPLVEDMPIIGSIALRALPFAIAVSTGLTAMGLYQARQRLTFEAVVVRMALALGLAALGLAVLYFIFPPLAQGRSWLALSLAIAGIFLSIGRYVFLRLVDEDLFRRRVLVYGAGDRATSLLRLRRRTDQRGFQILHFVPTVGDKQVINDRRVLELQQPLAEHAQAWKIDEIVVAMDDRRRGFPLKEFLDCKFAGISVVEMLPFLERETGQVLIDLINPSWVIYSEGFTRRSYRNTISRLGGLFFSVLLLLLTFPILILAGIAILIEDGRPIFYRQTRVGLMGEHFKLTKLRSMRKDAEASGDARWAEPNDERVTSVGRIIRKMRVDELPQLLNIIKGDMNFVGPRPERPEFVRSLNARIPYYHERHCVKPGLTGWAQLSYSYGSSEEDALQKLQYDLYYVRNQSLIFDLMILLQTVEVVLLQKGSR